ncbi:MAG: SDR family NAD(P)-dependent oxidoreductase [candidate division WOR-3 bacterium]
MQLEGRVALVAGGAKGIGGSVSRLLASKGAHVLVLDIDREHALQLVEECRARGLQLEAVVCDLTVSSEVDRAVSEVLERFGKVEILVNSVGGLPSAPPIEEMTEEEWDRVFNLNVKSVFLVTRRVVPSMKQRRYGKIVNFTSIGAISPPAHAIHYNTAKAAIIGFTLDLARALAPYSVNVNAVMPGPIKTPFYEGLMRGLSEEEKEQRFAKMASEVPMGRVGLPEEVASLVAYLVSDEASYITGAIIPVSGGLPLTPPKRT